MKSKMKEMELEQMETTNTIPFCHCGRGRPTLGQVARFFSASRSRWVCICKACASCFFADGVDNWKNALVGQFIGSAPNFSAMQKIVEMLWRKSLLEKVSLVGSNLYVFKFANSIARDWVLENGPWHIQHKALVLRKWEPNLPKLEFDLVRMPIWVHLFNVPLELYSQQGLSYIASVVGNPLYMDSITANKERLAFAKVCVEIKTGDPIPEVVNVLMQDGSIIEVRVMVPWLPPCCSKCKVYGHSDKTCTKGLSKPLVKVWKAKIVSPVEAGGSVSEIGESSNKINDEISVGDKVEDAAEVVMHQLDHLVGPVVGSVIDEDPGDVVKHSDGIQLAPVESTDKEFPTLHES
ncbi:hypothetical protein V6N13_089021 [Hibiscus sabdariffa]